MSDKLPAYQFYPADWLSDPALRSVGYAARGLWQDCLCLMHKSERRGYLQLNGQSCSPEQIARMTGGAADEVSRLLQELQSAGVSSATEDGILYSRRMVADEHKRKLCAEAGKRGGNPTLKGPLKGRPKGDPTPRVKRNPTPSSAASSAASASPAKKETTGGETGAGAPPDSGGQAIATVKAKTPQGEFVDRFKAAYAHISDGKSYQDDKSDYVLVDALIKKHGIAAVIEKAQIFAVLCKKQSAWFTKSGAADFTIGKLRARWNEILPQAHQKSDEDEQLEEMRRQEALRD